MQTLGARLVSACRPSLLAAVAVSLLLHAALLTVVEVEPPEAEPPRILQARLAPMKPIAPVATAPTPAVKQAKQTAKRKPRRPPPAEKTLTPVAPPEPPPEAAATQEPEIAGAEPIPEAPAVPALAAPLAGDEASSPLPARVVIRFTVNWGADGPGVGRAEYRWAQEGDRYNLQSIGEPTGVVALFKGERLIQTSLGMITKAGLQPESFTIKRGNRRSNNALFDWMEKSLKLVENDKIQTLPLPDGAQDMISFLFQFAFTPPQGEDLLLALTDGHKLERYRISVLGEETLQLAMGEVRTLHLKKPKTESDDGMNIWLAIDHHFLPVKVRNEPRKDERPIEFIAAQILVNEQ